MFPLILRFLTTCPSSSNFFACWASEAWGGRLHSKLSAPTLTAPYAAGSSLKACDVEKHLANTDFTQTFYDRAAQLQQGKDLSMLDVCILSVLRLWMLSKVIQSSGSLRKRNTFFYTACSPAVCHDERYLYRFACIFPEKVRWCDHRNL